MLLQAVAGANAASQHLQNKVLGVSAGISGGTLEVSSLLEAISGLMLLQIPPGHDPHTPLCWQCVAQGPLSGGYRFCQLWRVFSAALVALLPSGLIKGQVLALGGFGLS